MSTKADPRLLGWNIRDAITRLRHLGTTTSYSLDQDETTIGRIHDSSIVLAHGSVSERHAVIRRLGADLVLTDLGSTNGTRDNGVDRTSFSLSAGAQLEIGNVKLIAESARSIDLHDFLRRLVGWEPTSLSRADDAMGSVREMAHLHTVLLLHGEGSMRNVAEHLHRLTLGAERAFAAQHENESGLSALDRAVGGTLYLNGEALPSDIAQVLVSLRLAERCTRLVIGANSADAASEVALHARSLATIRIPMLRERGDELDGVLEAYARDAATAYGFESTALRPFDLKHVRDGGTVTTHERAAELMTRLVVERNLGVTDGAERLGITHPALGRYLRRAGVPT